MSKDLQKQEELFIKYWKVVKEKEGEKDEGEEEAEEE